MKKLLTILMVAALALSLVACGGAPATPAAPAPAASTPASSEAAPAESTPAESTPAQSAVAGNDWGLTEGYMGMSSANEAVCIGFNEDWSLSVFVAMSEDAEYASFVGPAVDNGDGTVTITDEENELALTFGVTELENGNLELDMGDLGTAEVEPCNVDEVVAAMQKIDEVGTAVA